MEALRQGCAMVLQKNTLFSGTIRENLRWGREDATDAEMEEACQMCIRDSDNSFRITGLSYRPDGKKSSGPAHSLQNVHRKPAICLLTRCV